MRMSRIVFALVLGAMQLLLASSSMADEPSFEIDVKIERGPAPNPTFINTAVVTDLKVHFIDKQSRKEIKPPANIKLTWSTDAVRKNNAAATTTTAYNPASEDPVVTGKTVMTVTNGFASTGKWEIDVKATVESTASPAAFSALTDTVTVKVDVTDVVITELTFAAEAGTIVAIDKDAGGAYGTPHWQDNSNPPDSDVEDSGDKKAPVAFIRASKMKVDTKFKLAPNVTPTGQVKVRGTGPSAGAGLGNLDFASKDGNAANGVITVVNHVCSTAFQNKISFFDPMVLSWEVSLDGGTTWQTAGSTSNQCYCTLATAAGGVTTYHTVIHVSCKAAKDKDTVQDTVDAVWAHIKGMKVQNWEGKPGNGFGYYRNVNIGNGHVQGLITDFDGKCGAWARFMRDLLKIHGIAASADIILPDLANCGQAGVAANDFLVNNWVVVNGNLSDQVDGIDGQGGVKRPAKRFTDHQVTTYAGKIYDPSYGTGPYNNLLDWQKPALLLVIGTNANGALHLHQCGGGAPQVVKWGTLQP